MGDKTLQNSASNMFAYLWEPCCPGETWSCSERGEAAAAGRGQTWPPVARSEQGWQGTEDRGWGGDCCVTILTEDIYTSIYLLLITREEKCSMPCSEKHEET